MAICTAAGHRRYYGRSPLLDTPEPWDAVKPIVRTEVCSDVCQYPFVPWAHNGIQKSTMIMKNLAGRGVTMSDATRIAAIQALLIFNAHSLLSKEPLDRLISEHYLGTITKASHVFLNTVCKITLVEIDCS